MGTGYTTGGDSFIEASHPVKAGQTFRVPEQLTLLWVDLDVAPSSFVTEPVLLLYPASANHEPVSTYISRNKWMIYPSAIAGLRKRTRFPMTPVTLYPEGYYCLVLEFYPPLMGGDVDWYYDKNDATYKYGLRISSNDGGLTWIKHHNDDHMFYVFGQPPAPAPPPDPPIFNWMGMTISYLRTLTGLQIIISTNVPCHLYMYWTITPPQKHKTPRLRRGVQFSDILDYCFVAWHENEQEELGDTDYHTFTKEPWEDCETRYFVFRATIAGVWSPSISPIFTKHRKTPQLKTFIAQDDNRTIQQNHALWPTAHDASSGTILANYDAPFFVIMAGESLVATYWIRRGFLTFNTANLLAGLPPETTIEGASLDIFITQALRTSSIIYPNLCITQGVQQIPVQPGNYGDQLPYAEIGAQRDFGTLVVGQYNSVPFNWRGLNFINPAGLTKLCLRGEQNILNLPPPLGTNWCLFHSVQKGVGFYPILTLQLVTP